MKKNDESLSPLPLILSSRVIYGLSLLVSLYKFLTSQVVNLHFIPSNLVLFNSVNSIQSYFTICVLFQCIHQLQRAKPLQMYHKKREMLTSAFRILFKHSKWKHFMKVCAFIALKIEVFNFFYRLISSLGMLKECSIDTR